MSTHESVTDWITQIKAGDVAKQKLADHFFDRLVRLAHTTIPKHKRRVVDGEDAANWALDSLFKGIQKGQYPNLQDREGLWPLLAQIAINKALKLYRGETTLKRGGGATRGESAFEGCGDSANVGIEQVMSQEPSPELVLETHEELERLLKLLPSDDFREVVHLKLRGKTNEQIAADISRSVATVERRLKTIRSIWEGELEP
jgi:DNA-directed RNA polymerase specialized sigma24 family protein